MAANRTRVRGRQLYLIPTDGGVNSGDPCLVGQLAGVALQNKDASNGNSIDTLGVYNLSVKAVDDAGNNAVAVGDIISYVTTDTPKLSKKAFNPGGPTGQQVVQLTAALTPVAVAANTAAEQTIAFAGVLSTDTPVSISKPTTQAGLAIGNVRIPSAGNVAIEFVNDTAGSITPTAGETYTLTVVRKGGGAVGVRFGIALGVITGGATANIDVRLG